MHVFKTSLITAAVMVALSACSNGDDNTSSVTPSPSVKSVSFSATPAPSTADKMRGSERLPRGHHRGGGV